MGECEVCMGENGMVVGTARFDVDDIHLVVETCRPCLTAMIQAMADQWNRAVADQNAAVDAMKKMFGLDDTATDCEVCRDPEGDHLRLTLNGGGWSAQNLRLCSGCTDAMIRMWSSRGPAGAVPGHKSDPGSGAGLQSRGQATGGLPPGAPSEGTPTSSPAGAPDVRGTDAGGLAFIVATLVAGGAGGWLTVLVARTSNPWLPFAGGFFAALPVQIWGRDLVHRWLGRSRWI